MPLVILIACVLFFCSAAAHRHAPHHRVESGCEKIRLAYTQKTGSRDDFVKTFPAGRQHHVLECIGDAK